MKQEERVGILIPGDYACAERALDGRIIAVTGATAGIGRAAALHFGQRGATVVLIARSKQRLSEVYDELEAAGAPQPAAVTFDFLNTDEAAYASLADILGEQFQRLDGLLLNASMLGEQRALAQAGWQAWQDVMQVNVNSQFLLLRALMPLLEVAENGSIVMTSAGVGRVGKAYWGAYAVSKFATEAMMQIVAQETENTSSVRVNAIDPGATNTSMRRSAFPGENPGDNPDPAAIMRSYLYLMDDASIGRTGLSFNAQ